MAILITGGAGYIGTHTSVELIESGYEIILVDNFSNSSTVAIERVEQITGKNIQIVNADIRNRGDLIKIFEKNNIEGVIHFAGLKSVNESIDNPIEYYGNPKTVPIKEDFPVSTSNPYGQSKLMTEQILSDIFISDNDWQIALLRYFNPVGAHESGLIGEAPNGVPNNLMPYISQVAVGKLEKLHVFGGDYDTKDGTCIRDFIHVVDLAKGHVKALDYFKNNKTGEVLKINLGTGKGYTVLELINTFQQVSGKNIPYDIIERRPGDVAVSYASAELANKKIAWKTMYNLEDMCRDTWLWQSKNPNGYEQ